MKLGKNTGLVLEGGGMRGVFTSGVLDAFMKYDLYFPYVVAVSAGACNGPSRVPMWGPQGANSSPSRTRTIHAREARMGRCTPCAQWPGKAA